MHTLMRVLQWLAVAAGLAGMAVSAWAFIDPSAFPHMRGGMIEPPSPRWRAAFGFVFSLAIAGWGLGLLRHRELPDEHG